MIRQLICLARGVAIAATVPSFVLAQDGTNNNSLPLKHDPRPTTAAISVADLMTRLYIFADDSMMGRETGTRGHLMSTAYIANELRRLGLKPAGDNGTFFQNVPMIRRAFDETSTITVDGKALHGGTDFIASAPAGAAPSLGVVEVVFGGRAGDTTDALTSDQLRVPGNGSALEIGKLTFDKLTDLYHAGTKHEEDQPAHLIIHDTNICDSRCIRERGK